MTADEVIQALGLPDGTRVNQRVPKKLLAEHGAGTAADKRHIQDGVDEITWLAALKPHLIGVPAYADDQRHYVELAVLSMTLKPGAKSGRLVELLHRAVPYPVLLLTSSEVGLCLSLAHLRTSQTEADKTVLDGELQFLLVPNAIMRHSTVDAFHSALALARQPQTDLRALYQGWLDTVAALDIAFETGAFTPSGSRAQAVERHAALQQYRQLQTKLLQLRAQAQRERQLARQVTLNHEIRVLNTDIESLQKVLNSGGFN